MIVETLKALYSGNISSICKVLNQSKYITDFKENENLLFHTGFSFLTHKGKKMFVYYELGTDTVLRGPESTNTLYGKIPQLIGLLCWRNGDGYIGGFKLDLVVGVNIKNEIFSTVEIPKEEELDVVQRLNVKDTNDLIVPHSEFLVRDGEEILYKFPLCKTCIERIFSTGHSFEEYNPSIYQNLQRNISTEEWYRQEFGDDAETAWWNTH